MAGRPGRELAAGQGCRACDREESSLDWTHAPSLFVHGHLGVKVAKVLLVFGERLCPAFLNWNDWLPAVATSRSASNPKHLKLARLQWRTERRLLCRGFGPVLRPPLHTPAVLDVLACALARWRVLLVHPAFVMVEAKVEEDMFLDALLSIGLALSRGINGGMVAKLRSALRARHDMDMDVLVAIAAQV